MKGKINFYISLLIITLAGAGATLLIVHVADANNFASTLGGSEASYSALQKSILKN